MSGPSTKGSAACFSVAAAPGGVRAEAPCPAAAAGHPDGVPDAAADCRVRASASGSACGGSTAGPAASWPPMPALRTKDSILLAWAGAGVAGRSPACVSHQRGGATAGMPADPAGSTNGGTCGGGSLLAIPSTCTAPGERRAW